MKIIARLVAAFLGVEGAVYAVAIAISTAVDNLKFRGFHALFLPVLILVAVIQTGRRIAAIGLGGPWRMLPDGELMFARALCVLVFAITVLYGGFSGWADVRHGLSPAEHMVLVYLPLSFLAQVLLLSRGARLPKILFVAACIVFVLLDCASVGNMNRATHAPTWPPLMILFTACWLWTIFRAPRRRRRGARIVWTSDALERLFVRLRGVLLVFGSPAHNVLRTERRGLGRLSWSLLLVVGWAVFMHLAFRSMPFPVSYHVVHSASLWTVAIATFFAAAGLTPRARLLWLRCADSRAQLFRACEFSALRRLLLLSFVTWATVTGLTLHRGTAVDAVEALLMLVACCAGGIAALYAGLLMPTLAGWGYYAMIAVVTVSITLIPTSWTISLGTDPDYPLFIRSVNFGVCLVICIALRSFAVKRWRKIDWTRLRPAPRRFARSAA